MKQTPQSSSLSLRPHEIVAYDESPLSSSFVETFVYEPSPKEEIGRGNLIIVGQIYSSLKRKENVDIVTSVITACKEEYYRHGIERDPLRAFRMALQRMRSELARQQRRLALHSGRVNVLVLALTSGSFYSAHFGEGLSWLYREKKLRPIHRSLSALPRSRTTEISNVVHSPIKLGDKFIVATKELCRVSERRITELILNNELESFLESHRREFRNMGFVSVQVDKEGVKRNTAGGQNLVKQYTTKKNVLSFLGRIKEFRLVTLGIASILALTLIAVGVVSYQRVQATERLVNEVVAEHNSFKDQAEKLLSLSNYQEAELLLIPWQETLGRLQELDVERALALEGELRMAETRILRLESPLVKEISDLYGNSVNFTPRSVAGNDDTVLFYSDNTMYSYSPGQDEGSFTILPDKLAGNNQEFLIYEAALSREDSREKFFATTLGIVKYIEDFEIISVNSLFRAVRRLIVFGESAYVLTDQDILRLSLSPTQEGQSTNVENWNREALPDQPRDMAIDGAIYVLGENDIVKKFFEGKIDSQFNVDEGTTKIATASSIGSIYLLNPQRGYITQTDKSGKIMRRLKSDEILGSQSFFVTSDEKTIYFLKDSKLFSLEIP